MGNRILINEDEKEKILSLYNINNPIISYLKSLKFPSGSSEDNSGFYDFSKNWNTEKSGLYINARIKNKKSDLIVVGIQTKKNDKCFLIKESKNIINKYGPDNGASYETKKNMLGDNWCSSAGVFMGEKMTKTKFDILISELKKVFDKI